MRNIILDRLKTYRSELEKRTSDDQLFGAKHSPESVRKSPTLPISSKLNQEILKKDNFLLNNSASDTVLPGRGINKISRKCAVSFKRLSVVSFFNDSTDDTTLATAEMSAGSSNYSFPSSNIIFTKQEEEEKDNLSEEGVTTNRKRIAYKAKSLRDVLDLKKEKEHEVAESKLKRLMHSQSLGDATSIVNNAAANLRDHVAKRLAPNSFPASSSSCAKYGEECKTAKGLDGSGDRSGLDGSLQFFYNLLNDSNCDFEDKFLIEQRIFEETLPDVLNDGNFELVDGLIQLVDDQRRFRTLERTSGRRKLLLREEPPLEYT